MTTACTQYSATIVNGVGTYPDMICEDDYGTRFKVKIPRAFVEYCRQLQPRQRIVFTGAIAGKPDSKGRAVVTLNSIEGFTPSIEPVVGATPPSVNPVSPAPPAVPTAPPLPVVPQTEPVVHEGRQGLTPMERQTIQAIANDLLDIALDLRSRLIDRGVYEASERIALLQSSLSAARDHVVGRASYGDRQYK